MALVEDYESQVQSIKKNLLTMTWHMRGGVTYEEIMNMSVNERTIISKIVEEHMETTKKSGLPYF
jgi:hypothetical protein